MAKPELVIPAGDLEKLKAGLWFGADAVYCGGKDYSLRAYAGNLSLKEIETGLTWARQFNKKIYITVNLLAHNRDMSQLPIYLEKLNSMRVDGLIIADVGVLRLARKYAPDLPLTISTQANVTNYEAAAFYRDLGISRIVLARELALEEIIYIKHKVDIELELFIHGAMCMAYSGRCLLSHYMTGRSANRGECAHPCRYEYALVEEKRPGEFYTLSQDERGSYIFNSKDLCLLQQLPQLMAVGIDAFKVEGRMKSPLYVASVAAVYRQAIDAISSEPECFASMLPQWQQELAGTATRPFTTGFIAGEADFIQDITKEPTTNRVDFCGLVKGYDPIAGCMIIEQRANFGRGEMLEIMTPGREPVMMRVENLFDQNMEPIERARHPRQLVRLPGPDLGSEYAIVRRLNS